MPKYETCPIQHDSQLPETVGSISVVGAGLAGLTAAVRLKRGFPDTDVVVIEKRSPQSNTQLAGQRFRAGIAGRRQDGRQEIEELLSSRNDGVLSPAMRRFAEIAMNELDYWHQDPEFLEFHDQPHWFGPQWGSANRSGKGRGKSVIDWFKRTAADEGVSFLQGEVQNVHVADGHVDGLTISTIGDQLHLVTDQYILAGGNMGGRLFLSTNKDIAYSPQELAFNAGLPLVGGTVHMIHPFGNCDMDGRPRSGCFETDELAGAKIYMNGLSDNPQYDPYSTELLRDRQGHYHFPEIIQSYREHGSVTRLDLPSGESKLARVSYHYGQLGIHTTDGTTVMGTDNLHAVGDASSIGYWTGYNERFPGFALLKCLVDARLVQDTVGVLGGTGRGVGTYQTDPISQLVVVKHDAIKAINTGYLSDWMAASTPDDKAYIGRAWQHALSEVVDGYRGTTAELTVAISSELAYAHEIVGSGLGHEPFVFSASPQATI